MLANICFKQGKTLVISIIFNNIVQQNFTQITIIYICAEL